MLTAPHHPLTPPEVAAFRQALEARDAELLPPDLPRWMFLQWLAGEGFLLHGSRKDDIPRFEPRTPHDLSADDFSKRTGVFAASDGLWAMMYALRDRQQTSRILNGALQVDGGEMGYFLSFAPLEPGVQDGRTLMTPGCVYVLPRAGFEQMPPYHWPGLGEVTEPHWVNPDPVTPLMCVPVIPDDFPFPVRTHDAARVDALCQTDPWGFPWLCENEA